jgi:hypothetical protein
MEKPDPITDLDLLKADWNKALDQKTASFSDQPILSSIILQNMKQQTASAYQRLQRNLLLEVLFTLVLLLGIIYATEAAGRHFSPVFWVVVGALSLGYHVYLYFKLKKDVPMLDSNLRDTLQTSIRDMSVMMRMYRLASWLMAIVIFFACMFGNIFTFNQFLSGLNTSFTDAKLYYILAQTVIAALAAFGAYVATRWYVYKVYGQHYEALLQYRNELNTL